MTRTTACHRCARAVIAATCAFLALPAAASADHGLLELGSLGANAASPLGMSDDGSRIYFATSSALADEDHDSYVDGYVLSGADATLITPETPGADVQVDHVSADGSRITFSTDEALTPADGDAAYDVYQRHAGVTSLLSDDAGAADAPLDAVPATGVATRDGTHVFFTTAEGLESMDVDAGKEDIYESVEGVVRRVTVPDDPGEETSPEDLSTLAGFSADGTHVYFHSSAALHEDDDDGALDVYERANGTTTNLISDRERDGNDAFSQPAAFRAVSADGRRVAYETAETITEDDEDAHVDVYVRSSDGATLESLGASGSATTGGDVHFQQADPDLTRFVFSTTTGLHVRGLAAGRSELLTSGVPGSGAAFQRATPSLSSVFFSTRDALAPSDTDGDGRDIYRVRDGAISHVTNAPGDPADPAAGFSLYDVSDDGSRAFFTTIEPSAAVGDTDAETDVYEWHAGQLTLLSGAGASGNGAYPADFFAASPDGLTAMFETQESLLTADEDGGENDVYVGRVARDDAGDGAARAAEVQGAKNEGSVLAAPYLELPKLAARAARAQWIARGVGIKVEAGASGTISADATVSVPNAAKVYRFRRVTRAVQAGQRVTVKLKLPRRALKAVTRALRHGKKLEAKVAITLSDAAGNRASRALSVRLKR